MYLLTNDNEKFKIDSIKHYSDFIKNIIEIENDDFCKIDIDIESNIYKKLELLLNIEFNKNIFLNKNINKKYKEWFIINIANYTFLKINELFNIINLLDYLLFPEYIVCCFLEILAIKLKKHNL